MRATLTLAADPELLEAALSGLVAANVVLLARRMHPPPVYASGVRYVREPRGRERWQTCVETFRLKAGDCEDLASWRCAELQAAGEPARVRVVRTGPRTLHVIVERADGRYEDPSARLGMRVSAQLRALLERGAWT